VEPGLTIEHEGDEAICRWRRESAGWILESSEDLSEWTRETQLPVVSNNLLEWRQPALASRRFFRLALP